MAPNGTLHDFTHLQDVMGNLPMLKRYIVLCLCFRLPETYSSNEIESTLAVGLLRLAKAFPFLAGQVIMEGRRQGCSGRPKIIPLDERISLNVNDIRESHPAFPSLSELSTTKYPFTSLDPAIILPPIASSWPEDPNDFSQIAPVLILQANLVHGGLLLTFSCNHMTADMTGMGMIISLFAKACRLECFTDEEIEQGNQPRGNIVPLLGDEYEPSNELEDVMVSPLRMEEKNNPANCSEAATKPKPASTAVWAYFTITSSNLARLKTAASHQTLVPYITTDDAVGALCWQAILRARANRLGSHATSTFARPISARRYLGLSSLYLGHMVDVVYGSNVDVYELPLGDVAARLRMLLQSDEKITRHVRAFATMLDRVDDKNQLVNVTQTSGAVRSRSGRCLECHVARRPRMGAAPSLLYLMPKDKDGGMAVAMCLNDDDLMALRKDEDFIKFADYVG
ncbi:hypothetical protein PV08_07612 [Exophiala spinifera]|uniref:Trichothecene 3-O-acetyltransferase-like N-terminal domain-containing protein n=1 Tax=Exophiala spinifera TaxID=91928 RepID=A0A0D1ZPT3_9EURO|nr:uncharacterized protein PV08_07612 [Exophiala spinifera]KIW14827.1 hypothetical protein PV08_07612 [Exophiala spinifera]